MGIQLSRYDLVDLAVQTEIRGEAFYRQAHKASTGAEEKELFGFLADEEVRHKAVFESLTPGAFAVEVDDAAWDDAAAYIAATVDSAFFSQDGAIRKVTLAESVNGMIRQAIGFEQQTILYFYTLRDLVREQSKSIIDKILSEERSHVKRLSRMLADRRAAGLD